MSASDHKTDHYVGVYLKVFGALMVLTVVTVLASRLHMTVPLAILVALAIALLKGSLVASFFMHLIGEKPLVFMVLLLTAILFAALMVLPVLTTKDAVGRTSTPWTATASAAH